MTVGNFLFRIEYYFCYENGDESHIRARLRGACATITALVYLPALDSPRGPKKEPRFVVTIAQVLLAVGLGSCGARTRRNLRSISARLFSRRNPCEHRRPRRARARARGKSLLLKTDLVRDHRGLRAASSASPQAASRTLRTMGDFTSAIVLDALCGSCQ